LLKEVFTSLLTQYTSDSNLIESLWKQILKKHSSKNRYYHTLLHLEHLYKNLLKIKEQSKDWNMMLFALFYHDYIYNILKKDNEEQSALKAVKTLNKLGIDTYSINVCNKIILATKAHNTSKNNDVNYFTDADLAILGSHWKDYKIYYENVRKETLEIQAKENLKREIHLLSK